MMDRVVGCERRSTRRLKTLISPTSELDSPERALIDHDSSKSYKLKSKIVYKKFFLKQFLLASDINARTDILLRGFSHN